MKLTKTIALTAALLAAFTSLPAAADRQHWHGDIRHFDTHDIGRWRGGYWFHGQHSGHLGWWWVVAGAWYFYPVPVYPYPDPYQPPVVVVQPSAPVITQPPPAPSEMPAPVQYWYYCESAKAYYPYVPSCPSGWKAVPATPPGAPAN